jgi:tRNA 2-selenouridine synthase
MIRNIDVEDLVSLDKAIPVVDVRTPAEYEQAHICGAFNIPLFSNEERVQVGTTYKQVGREEAILLGFDLTGNKWSGFIKTALELAPDKKVALHCWRGGMRSGAMAWALNLYGFDVYLLNGGYKSYRRWVLEQFSQPYPLNVIGGMTGSGKTTILHELKRKGEQVVDLEDLAQHLGSSYGTLNKLVQPSQEYFENQLATVLYNLDKSKPIWIEDESLNIGKRFIPKPIFLQMREATVFSINIPVEERVQLLAEQYGVLNKDFLVECTERIWKRLGPEQTKNAVLAIREDRMADFVRIVLVYYDKTYRTGLKGRTPESIIDIESRDTNGALNANLILEKWQSLQIQLNH